MKSADLGKCSKNIHASQEYLKPTLAAVAVRLDVMCSTGGGVVVVAVCCIRIGLTHNLSRRRTWLRF